MKKLLKTMIVFSILCALCISFAATASAGTNSSWRSVKSGQTWAYNKTTYNYYVPSGSFITYKYKTKHYIGRSDHFTSYKAVSGSHHHDYGETDLNITVQQSNTHRFSTTASYANKASGWGASLGYSYAVTTSYGMNKTIDRYKPTGYYHYAARTLIKDFKTRTYTYQKIGWGDYTYMGSSSSTATRLARGASGVYYDFRRS